MKKLSKISALFLLLGATFVGCDVNTTNSNKNTNSNNSNTIENLNVEHSITFVENDNCTISLSKEKALRDERINIEVTNITEGYEVYKITANGYKIDNYSFIMPNENVEVEVFLSQVTDTGDKKYFVKTLASEYAMIELDSEYYAPGEEVLIDYACKGNYVLDTFYVNEEPIEGTTFTMPDESVVIRGTFIDAIPDTPWQVSCACSGMTANSFWYFEYGDEGLNIKVIVNDKRVCGEEFVLEGRNEIAFSDNVEIILGAKNNTKGYVVGETYKFLTAYNGQTFAQVANSTTTFGGAQSLSSLLYKATASLKTLENKDGYNGYEVNMFVSYTLFKLDRASALNNLTACIAMRNTTTYGGNGSGWNCFNSDINVWNYCSNQPVIMEGGLLQAR